MTQRSRFTLDQIIFTSSQGQATPQDTKNWNDWILATTKPSE